MLTKTMTAFAAMIMLGSATAAFADARGADYDVIADQYPFLNQTVEWPVTDTGLSGESRRELPMSAAEKAWIERGNAGGY